MGRYLFSKTASGLMAAAEKSTEEEPDQRHARRIWSSRHQGPMKRSTFLNRAHSLRLGWSFCIVGHDMDDEQDHDTCFSQTLFSLNCKALCWAATLQNDHLQILVIEEILHHLGCIKPYKQWDIYYINWLARFHPSTVSQLLFQWETWGGV